MIMVYFYTKPLKIRFCTSLLRLSLKLPMACLLRISTMTDYFTILPEELEIVTKHPDMESDDIIGLA